MSCIYGSVNKSKFLELHSINKGKRKIENSILCLKYDSFDVYKIPSDVTDLKLKRKKYNMLLGIGLPKRKNYDIHYMNPVICDNWLISCFGDILNGSDVIEDYDTNRANYLETDVISCVMDYILQNNTKKRIKEIESLSDCLSVIEGSYSGWMHNLDTGNSFIFKSGHDIYANIYTNDFSSKQFNDSEPLNDGEIYQLTREGITQVGEFDISPND
jgi:hypothetical protein